MTSPFLVKQPILFKHCDPAGIVFYPRFFEMINDAAECFFGDALGMPWPELLKSHGVPTVTIQCTFQAPTRHGDLLDIAIQASKIGRTSVELDMRATCEGEERFASVLTLVHVNDGLRPEPWPDTVATRLKDYLKDQ